MSRLLTITAILLSLFLLTVVDDCKAGIEQQPGSQLQSGHAPNVDQHSLPSRFRDRPFRYMSRQRAKMLSSHFRYVEEGIDIEIKSNRDGTMTRMRPYSRLAKILRRASVVYIVYDSASGHVRSAGSHAIWGRQGPWYFQDSARNTIRVQYRYGLHPDSTHNSRGRRMLAFYGFGYNCGGIGEEAEEKFAMAGTSIGCCIVSGRMVIRAAIHNAPNDLIQCFRFGFGWKKQYHKEFW